MDVAGIAKLSTSMAETGTNQQVDIAVLKKAQDIAASTATQMISAIQPAPNVPNLPPHLGSNVNTSA